MRLIRIITRSIRDSFRSVFRNFSLSLASISCITITLIVVAISIVLSYNVDNFSRNVEKDVTIVAFLDVDITSERIKQIEDEIYTIDYVETIEFKDKMDIAKDMMSSSDVYKNIMQNWTREDSPLQDTYQVKVSDINYIGKVAKEIESIENVGVVKYGEGMVEQLASIFKIIRNVCIGAVGALIVVTAFLISNTIKITIFSRKREIEIMRLVGASNMNIKIPFMFEGLILGIIGAILPVLTTTYGYVTLYQHFNGQLFSPFIRLIKPEPFIYWTSFILIVLGMIVGMIGSYRAVRKYLKI